MMKQNKFLVLCAILVAGTVCLTACGNNRNNNTEAPYEDETNKDVNGTNNSENTLNNGSVSGDLNNAGNNLEDAGRNLMDSIKDTGDAIIDGVDNLGNGNRNNRTNP